MKTTARFVLPLLLIAATIPGVAQPPAKTPKRVPWTTSKITGTPEPPHPYKAQRVFPKLAFKEAVFMVRAPGIERWFVGDQRGKIVSFKKTPDVETTDLFADLQTEVKNFDTNEFSRIDACYALVFHPNFQKNRLCYICYILSSKKPGHNHPEGSRISSFQVTDTDPPRLDPKSEKVIITFLGGGHNGCDLHFGNDGMLYISTGDGTGPSPPDVHMTGQDISDLLSSILRIDVDRPANGKNYSIPKDNPFVSVPKARGEVYAYGFRNPWRMSFDRHTGNLWVGDVGWELWEMIYKIQKGGNYGWSIKEGPQDVHPNAKPGPTPILPPTIAFPHTEAASITGGYVYHGKKFPDLEGAYICGDWVSRKIWATTFDGDKIKTHREIAHTNAKIVAFGEDIDGELYIVDHGTPAGIYTLVPNPAAKDWKDTFPRKLSETGLFASTKDHKLAVGVRKYEIAEARWLDGASAERFLAFPDVSKAMMFEEPIRNEDEFWGGHVIAPKDAVFGKTISIVMERGNEHSLRFLETQLLHFDGQQWRGYTYVWNQEQTDADLLSADGKDVVLEREEIASPGKKFPQTWHFPSRTECATCHNPWSGFVLSFNPFQLNIERRSRGPGDLHDKSRSTLVSLRDEEFVEFLRRSGSKDTPVKIPTPRQVPLISIVGGVFGGPDFDTVVRSYLHVNCAHCHQFGGGGSVDLDLRFATPRLRMKVVNVPPVQGDFGISNAKIVAAGDPNRSTLYYRMVKSGRGHMPHLGSNVVDDAGTSMIRSWIRQMSPNADAEALITQLEALGSDGPTNPNQEKSADRTKVIQRLLESTDSALMLMEFVGDYSNSQQHSTTRMEAIGLAMKHPNPLVRDLFERFATPDQKTVRLGSDLSPQKLIALPGDANRGRELFFSPVFQCGQCHRVGKQGGQLGPELGDVAKRLSKTQIIESLLTPSKTIEPKYLTHQVETTKGQTFTGLLVEKTAKELVLRVSGDKEVRVPLADVESERASKVSLMPENLLRDATAAQAGDLLQYLWSLK